MAAEALEKKAAELGIKIKVETQGSGGAKNVITAQDVAGAKGVIIAADKNIELARFDGMPVYSCSVTRGINEPEALINVVMNGEAPVYHHAGGSSDAASAGVEGEGIGRSIYKNLMNGVSHMLPFVIGGGILTAIAFLIDQPGLGTAAYGSSQHRAQRLPARPRHQQHRSSRPGARRHDARRHGRPLQQGGLRLWHRGA